MSFIYIVFIGVVLWIIIFVLFLKLRALVKKRPSAATMAERLFSTPEPLETSTARNDYIASCAYLRSIGLLPEGTQPTMPNHLPRHDNAKPLGVSFFRTVVADVILDDLTLPRTYFGRSEIKNVSFCRTNLAQSTLCWNDFIQTDFSYANLSFSDLRASSYIRVSFQNADLKSCDLRRSSFQNCAFDGAKMEDAIVTRAQHSELNLSDEQIKTIAWTDDDGPEPEGG